MLSEISLIIQLVVGLVFLASSIAKLRDISAFIDGVRQYDLLPVTMIRPASLFVVTSETMIAGAHLSGRFLIGVVPFAMILLVAFMIAVIRAIERGRVAPCLCFGADASEVASVRSVARLVAIMLAEVIVWLSIRSDGNTRLDKFDVPVAILAIATAALTVVASRWFFNASDLYHLHRANVRQRPCFRRETGAEEAT